MYTQRLQNKTEMMLISVIVKDNTPTLGAFMRSLNKIVEVLIGNLQQQVKSVVQVEAQPFFDLAD